MKSQLWKTLRISSILIHLVSCSNEDTASTRSLDKASADNMRSEVSASSQSELSNSNQAQLDLVSTGKVSVQFFVNSPVVGPSSGSLSDVKCLTNSGDGGDIPDSVMSNPGNWTWQNCDSVAKNAQNPSTPVGVNTSTYTANNLTSLVPVDQYGVIDTYVLPTVQYFVDGVAKYKVAKYAHAKAVFGTNTANFEMPDFMFCKDDDSCYYKISDVPICMLLLVCPIYTGSIQSAIVSVSVHSGPAILKIQTATDQSNTALTLTTLKGTETKTVSEWQKNPIKIKRNVPLNAASNRKITVEDIIGGTHSGYSLNATPNRYWFGPTLRLP